MSDISLKQKFAFEIVSLDF